MPLSVRGNGGSETCANYVRSRSTRRCWSVAIAPLRARCHLRIRASPITVALPAVLLGRLKRAPVALWVLDLWPETLAALGVAQSKWLLSAVSKMVGFIYDRCALILVQSRAFTSSVLTHSTREDAEARTRYFPNWSEALVTDRTVKPAVESRGDRIYSRSSSPGTSGRRRISLRSLEPPSV